MLMQFAASSRFWLRLAPAGVLVHTIAGCALFGDPFGAASSTEDARAVSTQRALEYLPDGEALEWMDPETEEVSRITILTTTQNGAGEFCRDTTYQPSPEASVEVEIYCRDEFEIWVETDPANL